MSFVQIVSMTTRHSFKAAATSLFTTEHDSASELLLKGAALPIAIWACLFTCVEWLA